MWYVGVIKRKVCFHRVGVMKVKIVADNKRLGNGSMV